MFGILIYYTYFYTCNQNNNDMKKRDVILGVSSTVHYLDHMNDGWEEGEPFFSLEIVPWDREGNIILIPILEYFEDEFENLSDDMDEVQEGEVVYFGKKTQEEVMEELKKQGFVVKKHDGYDWRDFKVT